MKPPCLPLRYNPAGFTLLEMLVVITLVSLLAMISVPNFATFFNASKDKATQRKLLTAINLATSKAILTGENIHLHKMQSWNEGLIISGNNFRQIIQLQIKKGELHWRSSLGREDLVFSADGFLNGANGTFWFCNSNQKLSWAIRINQAARARIVSSTELNKITDLNCS